MPYIKDNKLSIGTRIKFIYHNNDYGLLGRIVHIDCNSPMVLLEKSNNTTYNKYGIAYNWRCSWSHIEPVPPRVGEQLMFSFMN